jgi:hypothetical protein
MLASGGGVTAKPESPESQRPASANAEGRGGRQPQPTTRVRGARASPSSAMSSFVGLADVLRYRASGSGR